MKRIILLVAVLSLLVVCTTATAELLPAEKLIYALLEAYPDIDPKQYVFLSWKGLEFGDMTQFDLVILNRQGTIYAITDSEKMAKVFEEEKKRKWELKKLESGHVILVFPKPDTSIEGEIEGRFNVRILSKTTLTPA